MSSYEDFAYVYDELMDETPYDMWKERIISDVEAYGVTKPSRDASDALESERNLMLDLGCGTGTLTQMLYDEGYDMIGVDASEAMLSVAMEKREEAGSSILYLLQDMRELELYSTIGTVISVCDSLNYILELQELDQVFSLVHNYLYPNGLFIFDFNTDYKYREVIGDSVIAENREDCSFIWENFYDEEARINEYDLTVFVQEEDELFRRFEETHFQKGYLLEEISSLLEKNSFELVKIVDADLTQNVNAVEDIYGEENRDGQEVQRYYVVARCIK